jgi:hypothetical protein
MSKTFQEIEISNGSWIKEQSDQIDISNENRLIDFSEDTFRLFDAMIFISYNASPLMHALNFLTQSLDYREYWEKSIDYIISDINLKEYNNKSKVGIETFVLLWNIISNKTFGNSEIKNQLIDKIIDIIYNSEMESNIEFLNDLNILKILGIDSNDLLNQTIKENNLENKIFKEINKIKTKSIHYINILNNRLSDEIKINNNWIGKPFNTKRFCLSQNKYRFKTIINNKMNIKIIKNTKCIIEDLKYKKYKNLQNFIWNNPDINDLLLISNITKFDISTVIKWFRNNIFNDLYDKYYYIKYEFGYFSNKIGNFDTIKYNYNKLDDIYKVYFNENKNINDYFIIQNNTKRYGIKYEKIKKFI